jgi:hypothetical protein
MLSGLFQAAAHLPPTVSHILLQALFTESLHGELPLPLSPVEGLACQLFFRLSLLKVHMESNSLPSPSFSSGGDCLPASSAGFIY